MCVIFDLTPKVNDNILRQVIDGRAKDHARYIYRVSANTTVVLIAQFSIVLYACRMGYIEISILTFLQ